MVHLPEPQNPGECPLDALSFRRLCTLTKKQDQLNSPNGERSKTPPTDIFSKPKGDLDTHTDRAAATLPKRQRAPFLRSLVRPNGPLCAHYEQCGRSSDKLQSDAQPPEKELRAGLYKCAECLQGFTVTVSLASWKTAPFAQQMVDRLGVICASKTQVSALQFAAPA